eukprot:TRINITY_DN64948_c0_g1_i1.p1 TRINITY_DN64948_c0_g1~~TRINITY_DN64948_c0_g1_i1.p1  ORF type:complete len:569 (+),score=101.81 TRINITY_DN64948_c0_g1_i1:107-1708(+)
MLRSWEESSYVETWKGLSDYEVGLRRIVDGRAELRDGGGASDGHVPLAPALELRYCSEQRKGGVLATALQAQGFKLLRHAEDSPRDRWPVFGEAIAALSQALVLVEQELFESLMMKQQGVGAAAMDQTAFFHTVSSAADTQASQQMLLPSLESMRTSQSPNLSWRIQVCVVLQEASREPSKRHGASILSRLRRLPLLGRILQFIAPESEYDTHNTLCLMGEYLEDHLKVRALLVDQLLLARAWHLLSRAQFDTEGRSREDALVNSAHEALAEECEERLAEVQDENLAMIDVQGDGAASQQTARARMERSLADFSSLMGRRAAAGPLQRNHHETEREPSSGSKSSERGSKDANQGSNEVSELYGWQGRAAEHLLDAHPLILDRASKCAEAGNAFLVVGRPSLAARAFEEAASACEVIKDVAAAHPPAGEELFIESSKLALAVHESEARARKYLTQAAQCCLMKTSAAEPETEINDSCLRAASLLKRADRIWEAATCSSRAGKFQPREVLDSLTRFDQLSSRVCTVMLARFWIRL